MIKKLTTLLVLAMTASAAYPWHGPLQSNVRDAWIDASLVRLAKAGYLPKALGDPGVLTNLEVAEFTARASGRLMAQLDLPPEPPGLGDDLMLPPDSGELGLPEPASAVATTPSRAATGDMQKLLEEFRAEVARMDVDVKAVEDRLDAMEGRLGGFQERVDRALKKTGSEVHGYGRGWMVTRRGLGHDPAYSPMSRIACNLMEMQLTSIPVPDLLFDLKVRMWSSFGLYFVDEISPKLEIHNLTLTSFNKVATVRLGDFTKGYTPLTLFNDDPWHYRFKPTYYKQLFSEVEEISMTDEGPAWHLRGLNVNSRKDWKDHPALTSASLDVIGGNIKLAGNRFGNYYMGGQADVAFLKDRLGLTGTGLMLCDDPDSALVDYNPDFQLTWAQKYLITSVGPRFRATLKEKVAVQGSFETAASRYEDTRQDDRRVYENWANRAEGSVEVQGVKPQVKYLEVGPYFYSPGAQTLRRTADPSASGYITADSNDGTMRDFAMAGCRNRGVFLDVGRPILAPYSRVDDNIFPYGDATPNRKGIVGGFTAELGGKKWVKPAVFYTSAKEIQNNLVLVPSVDTSGPTPVTTYLETPVENISFSTGTENVDYRMSAPRKFSGIDSVLEVDIGKYLERRKDKLVFGFGYRNQKTDVGYQAVTVADPYGTPVTTVSDETATLKTTTWAASVDFILPMRWMRWADMSLLVGQTLAKGEEFFNGAPNASYPFHADSTPAGTYSLTDIGGHTTFWAYNLKYQFNKNAWLRGDVYRETVKDDNVSIDTKNLEWRIGYEVHI